jgi:predicted amidohydrolase
MDVRLGDSAHNLPHALELIRRAAAEGADTVLLPETFNIGFFPRENLEELLNTDLPAIDKAISLCLFCMKTQIFNDGNKRAAVIYANHYLISHAGGLLVIPENAVPEFKQLLVRYYEEKDQGEIRDFLKSRCWKESK